MNSPRPPVVVARQLTKYFGEKRVVDGLCFDIRQGEFVGILGPNGAGKTTTLRMLVGNTPPGSGELSVLGYAIPVEGRTMRARIGVVPQQDNLDIDFTVVENLRIYGGYFGLAERALKVRIPWLLELAALTDKAHARIGQLSGGMKRRLSIARALINEPELLVLDEPTTGLDPQVRHNIWNMLRQLQNEGLTIILTTHYMEEAERLCGRIILMDRGRILADSSPQVLIRDHIEPHVLEVHGANAENWRRSLVRLEGQRCERVGESIFHYGDDLETLVRSLDSWEGVHYVYRRANLEDVFLKLTGRDLHDA
ncbi:MULTISPECIES: ATP-binding cassette domain-containing protein [Methylococcus]|uniref:Carbohydrate efflux ABC transporter, ATP-binding protein, NodI family n=2 Tax=Methylococcus capsulatus TaxID=414 RepID=Q608K6_METCA|nr:ATP-binding cassette domain-containing protein [Methylococcus capsulatus]AAU92491.1 carbohydrate efflux ABC transporter, ATP-binding protein, NodI family [Methylococcus capsulatus str. Bath]QXP90827.1 ATP-binding cassette domain-containing protein [Methylococcus capsulatus]QXP92441.1 ATP-binding cassette domain-containing protein [Methylococcus capsulatus]CAI8884370.1 Nod factor export ATP-binding protein I [Methylococcus capsulatus]